MTASHNPASDNGYKVYLHDGAQLVPPADRLMAEAARTVDLAGLGSLTTDRPRAPGAPGAPTLPGTPGGPGAPGADPARLIARLDDRVVDAYLDAVSGVAGDPSARDVRVVYTPMHGVGGEMLTRLFERAGFPPPDPVAAQAAPDPDFPTAPFPNPEEPGALDLALAQAERTAADVVLANDPDADRLAVAVPDPELRRWRRLSGDELGALLADYVLERGSGRDRLVATTVVSSSLLGLMAEAAGVCYAETLTGFKWIARAADDHPGTRLVYGYEEALGYAVSSVVRDKDGLSAALVAAELAAVEKHRARSLLNRLDDLWLRFGLHATSQWSARVEGTDGLARIARAMDLL
ncbi:MAG: hypothetical protein ACRD0H_11810, partial [Actinomycetes bacterium]